MWFLYRYFPEVMGERNNPFIASSVWIKRNAMKFSIIISAYNAECFIKRAIESVICNQQYNDYEIIIINDGSTDRTKEETNVFIDDRVILVNKDNTGVSDSRNLGIVKAKGEYLIFLDADDLIPDNFLNRLNTQLESINYAPDIIFGWYTRFSNYTNQKKDCFFEYGCDLTSVKGHKIWEILFKRTRIFFMPIMSQVFRRKFILDNNLLFDINQFISEDHDWRYSLLLKSERYYNCNLCTYLYCYNNKASISNTKYTLKKFMNTMRYLRKWFVACQKKEVKPEIETILIDIISRDYINTSIRILDIENMEDRKCAALYFKECDEMLSFATPLKYKISVFFYRALGLDFYLRFVHYMHKLKAYMQK